MERVAAAQALCSPPIPWNFSGQVIRAIRCECVTRQDACIYEYLDGAQKGYTRELTKIGCVSMCNGAMVHDNDKIKIQNDINW